MAWTQERALEKAKWASILRTFWQKKNGKKSQLKAFIMSSFVIAVLTVNDNQFWFNIAEYLHENSHSVNGGTDIMNIKSKIMPEFIFFSIGKSHCSGLEMPTRELSRKKSWPVDTLYRTGKPITAFTFVLHTFYFRRNSKVEYIGEFLILCSTGTHFQIHI